MTLAKASSLSMYCDRCDDDRAFSLQVLEQTVVIRNDPILATVPMRVCGVCGHVQPDPEHDPMLPLYETYRQKHGLLVPQRIRAIREQFALSRESFAALLGMSPATLYRYEGGSLQDEVHDSLIRLCDDPNNMQRLVERRQDRLAELQHRRFREALGKLRAHHAAG